MSAIDDITHKGWTNADFGLPIKVRARFAELGNKVIEMAMADPAIHQALTFTLRELDDPRGRQANLYTVSPALHSADDKLWLHVGYQTRRHVETALTEVPPELREFLDLTDEMLAAIELAFRQMLTRIKADKVADEVFCDDENKRVIHIRVVRYLNARSAEAPPEPVAGHADMSLCTLHLFETHGNWFQAVPYPQSMINDDQSPAKKQAVAAMRAKLKTIEAIEDQPIFFLGAGWKHIHVNELPACYHAGVRPPAAKEFISPYAEQVVGNSVDRVSLVVFAQPNIDYAASHNFKYASVTECRPDTAVK